MRENNFEELSALMDGEVSELEVRRVLRAVSEQPEYAARWQRYQLASAVLRKELPAGTALRVATLDRTCSLADRVSAVLAEDEPLNLSAQLEAQGQKARFRSRIGLGSATWWRPFASTAVAASVAAIVVIGWQQAQVTGGSGGLPNSAVASAGDMADAATAANDADAMMGQANVVSANIPAQSYSALGGAMPVAAGAIPVQYGNHVINRQGDAYARTQQGSIVPMERSRSRVLDEERFNHYLISHSSNAAFATQAGQLPYVRVVTLKSAEAAR